MDLNLNLAYLTSLSLEPSSVISDIYRFQRVGVKVKRKNTSKLSGSSLLLVFKSRESYSSIFFSSEFHLYLKLHGLLICLLNSNGSCLWHVNLCGLGSCLMYLLFYASHLQQIQAQSTLIK